MSRDSLLIISFADVFAGFLRILSPVINRFLPCCKQCRRGLAIRIMSVRPPVCLSVRLSVRLSDKRMDCDKTEERSEQILYHTNNHLA